MSSTIAGGLGAEPRGPSHLRDDGNGLARRLPGESLPEVVAGVGRIWTSVPKILVSNSRTSAEHDTRIVGGDDAFAQLAAIREETDGTIGVGGATLATQLLQHGLLDELLLYTHPAILGSGRPLFDEVTEPLECDLLEHATFESGVALNRYQIRGQRTE